MSIYDIDGHDPQQQIERRFYDLINQRLRLYQWVQSHGKVSGDAGECTAVLKTSGNDEYCAHLIVRNHLIFDSKSVVEWLYHAGARNIKILSVLYDETNEERNGFIWGDPSMGCSWIVSFNVSQKKCKKA